MDQRISLITLGVTDLAASTRFYRDVLGWTESSIGGGEVTFFQLNGIALSLFPREQLAADAGVDRLESGGHPCVALAHNVPEREDVDRVLERVVRAGARLVRGAQDASWGGRSGYFADPDGVLWEVAWNPGFPLGPNGSVAVPD